MFATLKLISVELFWRVNYFALVTSVQNFKESTTQSSNNSQIRTFKASNLQKIKHIHIMTLDVWRTMHKLSRQLT